MPAPLVFFDVETATPSGPPHLIEIGAVRVEDGEVVDTFQRLACPQVPVDPASTACHGLDDAALSRAADAGEVLGEFLEWIEDDVLVGHDIGKLVVWNFS